MAELSHLRCLARALAEGQTDAYAQLYDRLAPAMLRTAHTILLRCDGAEDVVHDVFVSLARSRTNLAQVKDLDAYLFTALRHAATARSVRNRQYQRHQQDIAQNAAQKPAKPSPESDEELDAALAQLPAEQREVIALKIDGDLTFAQIALVLNISSNTAASRYRYGLEKLRRTLENTL